MTCSSVLCLFLVTGISVLLIATCGRLKFASSLDNVWAHYKIVNDCVID